MSQLNFRGSFSFGVYETGETGIHRLVPAVKLAALLLLGTSILFSPLFPQLLVVFALLCLVCWNAGLRVRSLMKRVLRVLPFLLLIGVIQIFFISRGEGEEALLSWGVLRVYRGNLIFTAHLFGRFFSLILLFALFSRVTPLTELSHGTESLFSVFGKNPLAHDMSLIVTIMFRFIPILAQEAEHITKAQASRGGSFGTWKMGLIKKVRLYIPLIVPLFIAALERSEILVEAMESRCYEAGTLRTRLDEFRWRKRDGAVLLCLLMLFALLLVSRFYQKEILAGISAVSARFFYMTGLNGMIHI